MVFGALADYAPVDAVVSELNPFRHDTDRVRLKDGENARVDLDIFEQEVCVQGICRAMNVELVEVQVHRDYSVQGDPTINRPKVFLTQPWLRLFNRVHLIFKSE